MSDASASQPAKRVVVAAPRGYCAGVDRAVVTVQRALAVYGAPVYVRKQIVHNRHVVETLEQEGAVFVDELDEVPDGATVIFSAHGVSRAVRAEASGRGLQVFDATCPLVTKVHVEVAKLHKEGYEFIMIGHKRHPEVEGTLGQLPPGTIHLVETEEDVQRVQPSQTEKLAVVTQTTLSVDDAATHTLARRVSRGGNGDDGPGARGSVGDLDDLGDVDIEDEGGNGSGLRRGIGRCSALRSFVG